MGGYTFPQLADEMVRNQVSRTPDLRNKPLTALSFSFSGVRIMKNFLICNILALIIISLSPIHARADLSNDIQEFKTLYEELKKFKDNPKFHKVGFGRCCRFYKWMVKVETLGSKTKGIEMLMEFEFVPGDLLQLGMEYMKSRGRPTSYSKEMKAVIEKGLAPKAQP
jgi:hypothetical protein